MNQEQKHEMLLDKTHPSGEEEWYCPSCSRRLLLHWPPQYKKIVLNPGDEHIVHSGAKGGLNMGALQIDDGRERELPHTIQAAIEKIVEKLDRED